MRINSVLRSINAEVNRQARESDKRYRQHLKEVERNESAQIVQCQEDCFQEITSLHHECISHLDWDDIRREPEPQRPTNIYPLTKQSTERHDNFRPNFFHKILMIQNWRKKNLLDKVHEAKILDKQNHSKRLSAYKDDKKEWDQKQKLSKHIKKDRKTLLQALQKYLDISNLPVGKNLNFQISGDMKMDILLEVSPFEEIIPDEKYSLRQSGTLSAKKMPKGEGLELYQNYVCSALLRVARETLGTVPLKMVRANAITNAVNTKTGHLEDQVILSAIIMKQTLTTLNFNYIVPSDSLSNFIHNMNFKKTKGFESVEKVDFPK